VEIVLAVAAATGAVALLDEVAPITGLGVLYLLAVLFVAIRRGELPALLTALASVLTLNYFFIAPRHRLTIADSENVVALAVFLIAAVVVGRLAADARQRATEAEARARLATAREREAAMLARAASDVMAGTGLEAELRAVGEHVAEATGAAAARLELAAAPTPRDGEVAVRLPLSARPGWLYASPAPEWREDDLLDLSRIESGAVDPRPDWCDLHDVVTSAAAGLTDHPLELMLPRDLPLVRADAAQLERVFANLLSNAVRFSPEGAPVRVSAGVGGGAVTVTVTDRGRGIAASHRRHVFEPFYRGPGSRGSGLGLAICRGFVEANGGRIRLLADTGEGTAFAVSLPLVQQPAPAP